HTQSEQNRVNQTLLVGHIGFPDYVMNGIGAVQMRRHLTLMHDRWHGRNTSLQLTTPPLSTILCANINAIDVRHAGFNVAVKNSRGLMRACFKSFPDIAKEFH
ncbi:hypothetical protein, partial [Pseudomonas viridiflava]|uniref:hypothetical protein n=1 Tax=Pseudomonas viridiflava TaxID=33069 RepID=UPI00197D5F73